MAFYHGDGFVPAWSFAMKYAGPEGHVATLPEIIEARLATKPGDLPWKAYYTTSSAEYYGIGADGRPKLIVAHGVGPMSTPEGVKKAYSWEYRDRNRNRRGGRISAAEFLKLEAGEYGPALVLESTSDAIGGRGHVIVIDFQDYLSAWGEDDDWRTVFLGKIDSLLMARLGRSGIDYLNTHRNHALEWHRKESIRLPDSGHPYLVQNKAASNCPYTTYKQPDGSFNWLRPHPIRLEPGKAMGHLLTISGLCHMHCGGWEGLTCDVACHEWSDGTRLVGVPAGAVWKDGIGEAPQPHEVLRRNWQRFMQPYDDTDYNRPRLFLLELVGDEWFTRYPKLFDGESMDEGDIEFHVRSVQPVGGFRRFQVDEQFFLRYRLSQVVALAPDEANAYEIVDISPRDRQGLTTVAVRFYKADVDTSERLPRVKEVKQNYDLLMG